MKAPLSWLKDFVDIDMPIAELAHRLTMAGMEVEEIHILGLPMPEAGRTSAKVTGFTWDRDKIVTAVIREVMPHPNADRLVLCRLFDGELERVVLTGAPNLFEYKGIGPLAVLLKVAYAREGARIFDGHQDGYVLTTLKRTRIRGVDSDSMVCSEKELGISDEHEGIMFLEPGTEPGIPLVDVLGDAILDINLLPSFARCASMLGLAREIAAITGRPLRMPQYPPFTTKGESDFSCIEITDPVLNPRFVLGLIRDVTLQPSPMKVQHRLKMAGMRSINNIVDATNYAMLELGEPLHAFDYDVLQKRAVGKKVKVFTRTAAAGETLTTLDGVVRKLDPKDILVFDEAGALSIAGVMGGLESEVSMETRNILLEGASWNMINIRRTAKAHNLPSEASYRFSRGVHPSMAESGVKRGLELMSAWADGKPEPVLVDNYPLPPTAAEVEVTPKDVKRWLGLTLSTNEIANLLARLEFAVRIEGERVLVVAPNHRLDIGEGVTGTADLVEEVARIYGYDNIPEHRMTDELPVQKGNPEMDKEEKIRDLLVGLGLQEIISYRWTTPERESRRLPPGTQSDDHPYIRIANPLAYEKSFLRHSVLASLLDAAERNSLHHQRLAFFEIGPVFLEGENPSGLPDEQVHLSLLLAGQRHIAGWQPSDSQSLDFFDLKGVLNELFTGLRLERATYSPGSHPSFHPGKCALIRIGDQQVGVFGEVHPRVIEAYHWADTFKYPVLAADIDLKLLVELTPFLSQTRDVPSYPAVMEDLAFILDETTPAASVAALIHQTGGKLLTEVRLFDLFRSEALGMGKKSLAFRLTYQAPDRTLTDAEVSTLRSKIIKRLEFELGAKLRSV